MHGSHFSALPLNGRLLPLYCDALEHGAEAGIYEMTFLKTGLADELRHARYVLNTSADNIVIKFE